MDIQTLTDFFMWCTVINVGLLLYGLAFIVLAPDFLYRYNYRLFSIPKENFHTVYYALLGMYKILTLIFCLTPYITLLILK